VESKTFVRKVETGRSKLSTEEEDINLIQFLESNPLKRQMMQFPASVRTARRRIIRCDQLKNKSSRRVTYGNPCYSIGSKANSIYFLNDRSVYYTIHDVLA
jgi:hypothetical protein